MTKEFFSQYLKAKLPIADVAGLKLENYSETSAQIQVTLGLMNQNPFNSMFWAVQGMAAELSTGVLCMEKIAKAKKGISMLVIKQEAEFTKKAVGTITFTCNQGAEILTTIDQALQTGEGETFIATSIGKDEQGDVVSTFHFTWSFKVKQ